MVLNSERPSWSSNHLDCFKLSTTGTTALGALDDCATAWIQPAANREKMKINLTKSLQPGNYVGSE